MMNQPAKKNNSVLYVIIGLLIGLAIAAGVAVGFILTRPEVAQNNPVTAPTPSTNENTPPSTQINEPAKPTTPEPVAQIEIDAEATILAKEAADQAVMELNAEPEFIITDSNDDRLMHAQEVSFEKGTFCGLGAGGGDYSLQLGGGQTLTVTGYAHDVIVYGPDGSILPYDGQDYGQWITQMPGKHLIEVVPNDDSPRYFDVEFCAY